MFRVVWIWICHWGWAGRITFLYFLMLESHSAGLTGNFTLGVTVGTFLPWGRAKVLGSFIEIKQRGGLSSHEPWVYCTLVDAETTHCPSPSGLLKFSLEHQNLWWGRGLWVICLAPQPQCPLEVLWPPGELSPRLMDSPIFPTLSCTLSLPA